ncbi:VOC family protein [Microlunatus sp. Gsoil 973]|uniref:VOC family protein n=1 Tax=Microlunatus sp. Gsoil 973 TaxID=2672569 RepID=UPI0012B4F268|nr:VOC family protein [Microlunatus sp. Gsoil 973]QGN33431.1 hypothetical protein GJV80_12105 [Microlunatus sp. Gsoil 973]
MGTDGETSASTPAFKDVVIDATDGQRMADFWAAAIGLEARPNGTGGDAALNGSRPVHTVWVNQVPEPRTVKQRVHLDLLTSDIEELIKLGASVSTRYERWTVMLDPEGGEFCAFAREPARLPDYRMYELVVDSADPESICRWWGERFDLEPRHDADDPWWWLEGGSLPWPWVFNPVPEPKTVKNRLHWDVWGRTEDYLAAGAALLRGRDDEISWDVLSDPEGNEFCVFAR